MPWRGQHAEYKQADKAIDESALNQTYYRIVMRCREAEVGGDMQAENPDGGK